MARIFKITHGMLRRRASAMGLKGTRGKNYWSEYRLAKTLGVSQTQLSKLKATVRKPDPRTVAKLCGVWIKHLGMTRDAFYKKYEEVDCKP